MSFLNSLFNFKKKEDISKVENNQVAENISEKFTEEIYIAIDHLSLKVFGVKTFENKNKELIWTEEKFFATYENLGEGERVKNFFVYLSSAINDLSHRIEGSKKVFVSVPLDGTFLSNMIIPKTEKSLQILASEMKKKVPIPFNEIMFASNKVFEMNNLESYFCLCMQKTVYDDYINVFKNFGISPYIEIGVFSLARFFPKRSLAYQYKVLIYVSHNKTQMIFCRNNLVMEVVFIETGISDIENEIIKQTKAPKDVVRKIIKNKNLLKDSNRESFNIIQSTENQILQRISGDAIHNIFSFENKFNIKIEYVYLSAISNNTELQDLIINSSEKSFICESFNTADSIEFFINKEEISFEPNPTYTHLLGLAKKDI